MISACGADHQTHEPSCQYNQRIPIRPETSCNLLALLSAYSLCLRASRDQLQHISDIRSAGRIGEHRGLHILGRQTVAYREAEEIDYIFGMWPDEMAAQGAAGVRIDQCLETVDRFIEAPGCVPIGNLFRVYTEFEPPRPRIRRAQTTGRDRRDCERDARDTPIVGLVHIAVEQVSRDDFAVVARHGRQRRTAARRIAGRVDLWVGYALEKFVGLQAAFFGGAPG